jgi:hypothetical protein
MFQIFLSDCSSVSKCFRWLDCLIQIISFESSHCQRIVKNFIPVVFVIFDWTGDNDTGTCAGCWDAPGDVVPYQVSN